MKFKITLAFILLFSVNAFAWDNRPQLRWQQYYRHDLRKDQGHLYANRFSAVFNFANKDSEQLFKLIAYMEARRNFDRSVWERNEIGLELGKDITGWLYLGQAIQRVWTKEDFREYRDIEERDDTESESKFMLSHLLVESKYISLKGFILDEYTYNFSDGRANRNEVAIGLIVPIANRIETGINWRHIDRIHYYDSDAVEAQMSMIF